MPSRRGSIVKVSPFVPAAVETTVKPALAVKPAPAELAVAFAKLKTAKPDFPYDGQPGREVVAVVDPYSTGACVAAAAAKRGFKIIHVMSAPDSGILFHDSGILRDINVDAITSLPSYRGHAVYAKVGSAVAPTKDLFGWGGAVKLANADAEQLVKDYAVIEELCHSGLWTIE